jgi:hypothetical protein
MTADEELFARVSGNAPLAALVGDRIYPQIAPQAAPYPFIRYQKVSRVAEPAAFDAVNGVINGRWQFDVYASTFTTAQAVQAALAACLDDWRPAGQTVIMAALVNAFDRYEGDDATRIYRSTQEYQVTFKNA